MGIWVGVITEGGIDDALLPALLQRIACDRAGFDWPVSVDDQAAFLPVRKRGHGGVLDGVEQLIAALGNMDFRHGFFIAMLDQRTAPVQEKINKLIVTQALQNRILVAAAIKEIEAWWLGDRTSTLGWFRLDAATATGARYFQTKYKAESDQDPKSTLGELIDISDHIQALFGDHYCMDMAEDFGAGWKDCANLDEIESQCPRGFKPFCRKATQAFKRELAKQKRI